MTMLRLIQYSYVFLPVLGFLLGLSSFIVGRLHKKLASLVLRLSAVGVLVLLVLNVFALQHYRAKLEDFEIKGTMTKADVTRQIGIPPTRVDDLPQWPGASLWHYTITVPPFKYRRSVEFDGDEAIGSSRRNPSQIGLFDW